ncbi:histidinol-phosphate transaminase [Granulicella sp. L60]|uniref:histidinol-phosphate transaminase n=1 Tax=Granulicella sp. L60 TaxID=1641866 RepID=UPI00131DE362|nr:histidinol-phosphate transaminase [Granulicella sp. L60]
MKIANMAAKEKVVQPRKAVLDMPEYHPPLAGRDALRLDFNENTFSPSPRVMERLHTITADDLTRYPEREPVERIVAEHFGLQAQQVLLTNGVDEAIHLMCAAFLDPDDEALISTPTFFMYDVSVQMMTLHLRKVQADETLEFPFERFMASITEKTKLIIVASPNNPTGAIVDREHLLAIAAAAPQAVLMVDEAYYHFDGTSIMGDLALVPNLVIARTFSKAYGLANLRIGMLAGNADLLKYVRKVCSPYNVNGVALSCLPAAITDETYLSWYVEQVRIGRERLMDGLRELGVPFFRSHANFVLMNIGSKHKDLVKAMHNQGVLLRDRSADPGCDGFVRITIGLEHHVTQGLAALKISLQEIGWSATV